MRCCYCHPTNLLELQILAEHTFHQARGQAYPAAATPAFWHSGWASCWRIPAAAAALMAALLQPTTPAECEVRH